MCYSWAQFPRKVAMTTTLLGWQSPRQQPEFCFFIGYYNGGCYFSAKLVQDDSTLTSVT